MEITSGNCRDIALDFLLGMVGFERGSYAMRDIVSLWDDREEIVRLGTARWEDNHARAERYSPTPPSKRKHIEGVRGEFGGCRGLDIEPEWSRIVGYPRPKHDAIYRGWLLEIKDTVWDEGHLLYQPKLHELFVVDIWLLVVEVNAEEWLVRVAGWIWESQMQRVWSPCRFDATAFCVHQRHLRPLDELIDIREK